MSAAVRYELISWWQGAVDWQPTGGDNLTATTFRHPNLVAGVTYHYLVRTIEAAGQVGTWSETVSATVLAPQSPTVTTTPTAATTPTPTATPTATSHQLPTATPTSTPTPTPTATPASDQDYVLVSRDTISFVIERPNIRIDWALVPEAVHYNIYYCLALDADSANCRSALSFKSSYELIARQLTATTFLHENLLQSPTGTTYTHHYLIQACLRADCPILTRQTPTATPTATPTPAATPTPTLTATPTQTPAAAAPPAPVLTARPIEGAVELRWDPVPDAVRYKLISWQATASGWQQIGGDNLTAATYAHTQVATGTTYYYRVHSVNAAGEVSPWSEYVSAIVTSAQSPTPTPSPSPTPSASPTLTPTPAPAAGAHVSSPPQSLNVHSYYRKYLDAGGIPVLSSLDVSDEELYQARGHLAGHAL